MVDNVNIVGVGNNQNPPLWSTEETLGKLYDAVVSDGKLTSKTQDIFKKMLDVLLKDGKISKETLENINDTIDKRSKETVDAIKENRNDIDKKLEKALNKSASRRTNEETNVLRQQLGTFGLLRKDLIDGMQEGNSTFINKLSDKLGILGGPFTTLSAVLPKATFALTTLVGAVGAFVGFFTNHLVQSTKLYSGMYESGVSFNETIDSMRLAQGKSGLAFDDFSNLLKENTELFSLHNVKLTDFATQALKVTKNLSGFNISVEQGNEFYATYLSGLRRVGIIEGLTNNRRTIAVENNIKQLTRLSAVMGKSRDQILKDSEEMLGEADFTAYLASLPEETRKMVRDSAQQLTTMFSSDDRLKGIGSMFMDMLANPSAEASKAFDQIVQVSPQLAHEMASVARQVRAGNMSEEQAKEAFSRFTNILRSDASMLQQFSIVEELRGFTTQMLNALVGFENVERGLKNANTVVDPLQKATNDVRNGFKELMGQLSVLTAKLMETINPLLASMADKLKAVVDWFTPFLKLLGVDTRRIEQKEREEKLLRTSKAELEKADKNRDKLLTDRDLVKTELDRHMKRVLGDEEFEKYKAAEDTKMAGNKLTVEQQSTLKGAREAVLGSFGDDDVNRERYIELEEKYKDLGKNIANIATARMELSAQITEKEKIIRLLNDKNVDFDMIYGTESKVTRASPRMNRGSRNKHRHGIVSMDFMSTKPESPKIAPRMNRGGGTNENLSSKVTAQENTLTLEPSQNVLVDILVTQKETLEEIRGQRLDSNANANKMTGAIKENSDDGFN